VLGDDPFGEMLDTTTAGETINGLKVVSRRIKSPREAFGCRVLFISSSEENQLKEILAVLCKSSILTVSDMVQFSQRGGMIQFVFDRNRVRFEVNLTNARTAGLNLSSELLKLAVAVRKSSRSGG
jgi:hypothetical protein